MKRSRPTRYDFPFASNPVHRHLDFAVGLRRVDDRRILTHPRLGEVFGWHSGFAATGVGMPLAIGTYLSGQK